MQLGLFAQHTTQYLKPHVADWHKIGDYRQCQTDHSNIRENNKRVDYDYKVGDKVLIRKDDWFLILAGSVFV